MRGGLFQSPRPPRGPPLFKIRSVAEQIESELADLDVRGFIKIISSNNKLANFSELYDELKKKHPAPTRELKFPLPPDESTPLVALSSKVLIAIKSFPTGSSGGLDGLSPQHFKDLVSYSAGNKLLTS